LLLPLPPSQLPLLPTQKQHLQLLLPQSCSCCSAPLMCVCMLLIALYKNVWLRSLKIQCPLATQMIKQQ